MGSNNRKGIISFSIIQTKIKEVISLDIKNNKYYKLWFKDPMTYVMGAVLLSVFQIITFAVTGNPWGVTGPFANWGAWVFELFG